MSRKLEEFLHANGQVDFSFVGLRFTWYNDRHRGARVWEWIDYVFVTVSWIQWQLAHVVPSCEDCFRPPTTFVDH